MRALAWIKGSPPRPAKTYFREAAPYLLHAQQVLGRHSAPSARRTSKPPSRSWSSLRRAADLKATRPQRGGCSWRRVHEVHDASVHVLGRHAVVELEGVGDGHANRVRV